MSSYKLKQNIYIIFGSKKRSACLRKSIVFMLLFFIQVMSLYSQFPAFQIQFHLNYETRKSGYWNDPSVWKPEGIPGKGDNVLIRSNHVVTIPGNYKVVCNNITIDNSTPILSNCGIITQSSGTSGPVIHVQGNFTDISKNNTLLNFSNADSLIIEGDLLFSGYNLSLFRGANITIVKGTMDTKGINVEMQTCIADTIIIGEGNITVNDDLVATLITFNSEQVNPLIVRGNVNADKIDNTRGKPITINGNVHVTGDFNGGNTTYIDGEVYVGGKASGGIIVSVEPYMLKKTHWYICQKMIIYDAWGRQVAVKYHNTIHYARVFQSLGLKNGYYIIFARNNEKTLKKKVIFY